MLPLPSGRARGGGDAGSLLPGVLPPQLAARRHAPGVTRRVLSHLYHTHHTRLRQGFAPFVLVIFCCAFNLSTMDGVGNATAAAMRRRQRRLRSWLRHERMTVAIDPGREVAPHLKRSEVCEGRGRRCCTTRTTPYGDRRHHLRGCGPGSLCDPGPQRSDRTVRRSSGEVPLLAVPGARWWRRR